MTNIEQFASAIKKLERAFQQPEMDTEWIEEVALDEVYSAGVSVQVFLELVKIVADKHDRDWTEVEPVARKIAVSHERQSQVRQEIRTHLAQELNIFITHFAQAQYQKYLPDIQSSLLTSDDLAGEIQIAVEDETEGAYKNLDFTYFKNLVASFKESDNNSSESVNVEETDK